MEKEIYHQCSITLNNVFHNPQKIPAKLLDRSNDMKKSTLIKIQFASQESKPWLNNGTSRCNTIAWKRPSMYLTPKPCWIVIHSYNWGWKHDVSFYLIYMYYIQFCQWFRIAQNTRNIFAKSENVNCLSEAIKMLQEISIIASEK